MSATFFLASDTPLKEVEGKGFVIYLCSKMIEFTTNKKFFACLEWGQYSFKSASGIVEYIKEQLSLSNNIELWYTWLDNNIDHPIHTTTISSANLSTHDLKKLAQINVWEEPVTDYVFQIKRF